MLKASLVFVCCIYLSKSQDPYPPSGYRPPGRQFELPRNFGINSNFEPDTQYGTPQPQSDRFSNNRLNQFERQQKNLQPQSQYGTPNQTPPPQQYLPSDPPSDNFDGRHGPNYLQPPTPNQREPPNRQYFPTGPSSQGTSNDFERPESKQRELTKPQIKNFNGVSGTEVRSGRQNYLPPNPTKRTRQRGYPEQTTKRPRKQEEPIEDEESENPNIAISTAVANGQYYLIQPNGALQPVASKVTQNVEDSKSNGFTARIVYQNLNPVSPPFYTPFIAI